MKNDDFWHWRQACYDYMIELSSQYNLKPVNVMSQLFFHAILTLTHNVTAFHCLKWYVKLYTKVGNITGKKDTVGLLFEIVDTDNKIYYIPVVGNHDNKIYYIPVVGNHDNKIYYIPVVGNHDNNIYYIPVVGNHDNKIYYIPVVGNHDNKIYYIPVVGNHDNKIYYIPVVGNQDNKIYYIPVVGKQDNKIYYIPVVGNHDNKIYYIPVVGNHHLCRNPNGTYTGPWCYTDSTYRHKELCDIPKCGESMYNILSFISRLDIFFLVSLTDTEKYWLV
jgi:hypothetical protein